MVQLGDETGTAVSRRRPIYRDLVLLLLAALVLVSDQLTKFLVREFLERYESFPEDGFFRITHAFNTGSAFGLFRDQNIPLILVSVVGISILVLIYRSQRRPGALLRLSLGLQLGGAVGNLLDRVRLGHVTDFADVGGWPIFNVADASIVVGLLILMWIFLGVGSRQEKTAGAGVVAPREDPGLESKFRAGYAWCPVCGGDMLAILKGWKCSSCGARERVDPPTAGPVASGSACAPAPARKEGELGEFCSILGKGEISPRPGALPMGE